MPSSRPLPAPRRAVLPLLCACLVLLLLLAPVPAAGAASAAAACTRIEDNHPSVTYTLGWATFPSSVFSGGSAHVSNRRGAAAVATYELGDTATHEVISTRGPQMGIASITVANASGAVVDQATVDLYAPALQPQVVVFSGKSNGSNTIRVRATGMRNPASSNSLVVVDAFDLCPATL